MKTLTPKQEAFALEYILKGDATAAYRACYDVSDDAKDTGVWVDAHKVLHNPKVSLRVQELRTQQYAGDIATVTERKNILTQMIRDGNLKALDMLNKMDGEYVEKLDITANVESVQYYSPKKNKDK